MSYRRLVVGFSVLAMLAACRGAGAPSIPAAPGARETIPMSASTAGAGVSFIALGPTHMTSGSVPTAGKTNAYAVDPNDPRSMYLASGRGTGLETYSSAGIYHTTDGGNTWKPLHTGLTDSSGLVSSVINTLWIDPNDPKTLLAGSEYDGVYRSTDGGESWHNVYRTTQATQFFELGKVIYATSSSGVLESGDGGTSWRISLSGVQPTALGGAAHSAGATLYAGTTLGAIEMLSAGKWSKIATLPFNPDTHTQGSTPAVHQLAVDPYQPSTIFASTNDGEWDQELFGSSNGGKTWVAVLKKAAYQYGLGTQAIAFSLVHKHRLYVGGDGAFYYVDGGPNQPVPAAAANLSVIDIRDVWVSPGKTDDTCVVASDQGLDRVPQCSTPTNSPQDNVVSKTIAMGLARHFAISPNAKTQFVSLQDFDSHISYDGGATWAETQFYEDGFNELRPGNPQYCYVLDEAYGLSVSSDGCRSFPPKNSAAQRAIVPSRLMAQPIAFDPKNPQIMYLLSGPVEAPGIQGQRAIFKTTDGGTTFVKEPWHFVHAGAIVVDPRDGSHIIVSDLTAAGSTISTSRDGGKSWTRAKGVEATQFWYTISISPVNGTTVLASSMDAHNDVFVLRSTDGGATFQKTATIVNAPLIRGRIDEDRAVREEAAPPAFVYSPVREIRYNDRHASGVSDAVLTTLRGAYLSSDDGVSWQRIDRGTISHSFWGIRWNAGYLYIGSDGQGLLRSNAPVQLP